MTRGSLQASPKGIEKAKQALIREGLTQKALAEELFKSRSTVNRFFNGHRVDRTTFQDICEKLNLNWKEIRVIPADETESTETLESVVSDMLARIESQQDRETLDLQKINTITAIRQVLEQLNSTNSPSYLNEINTSVAQDKIKRLHAHLILADYLESGENRKNLAMNSAATTMKYKVLEKIWKSSAKREQAQERLYKLLYNCLCWLLESIKEFHDLEISDNFRKGLRSWHPDITKYAFKILEDQSVTYTGRIEVASEVSTYLNLLIERVY